LKFARCLDCHLDYIRPARIRGRMRGMSYGSRFRAFIIYN
jgi:hypothetical protein